MSEGKEPRWIGGGFEKNVYEDYLDPENKVSFELTGIGASGYETVNQVKSRYYLQKILHLLFPENIPNVHLAATKPKVRVRMERIKHDEIHKKIETILHKIEELPKIQEMEELLKEEQAIKLQLSQSPAIISLQEKLKNAGINDADLKICIILLKQNQVMLYI